MVVVLELVQRFATRDTDDEVVAQSLSWVDSPPLSLDKRAFLNSKVLLARATVGRRRDGVGVVGVVEQVVVELRWCWLAEWGEWRPREESRAKAVSESSVSDAARDVPRDKTPVTERLVG